MKPAIQGKLRLIVDTVFEGSVNAAAQAVGMDTSTLFRVVEGSVMEPRLGTLDVLADGYGVPLEYLLGRRTAEQVQDIPDPLAEKVWLIWTYWRRKQALLRNWLEGAKGKNQAASKLIQELQNYWIFPPAGRSPLRLLEDLTPEDTAASPGYLGLMRELARLELHLLEEGARRLAQTGVEPLPPKVTSVDRPKNR